MSLPVHGMIKSLLQVHCSEEVYSRTFKVKNKKQKLTFYDLHVFSSFWAEQDNMAAIFPDVCQSLLYRPVVNIYKSQTSSSTPDDRMCLTCDAPRYWLNHDMYRVRFSKTENNNNNKKKMPVHLIENTQS